MNKYHEPNCDMFWDIYLDWLADQGFDELRELDLSSLVIGNDCINCYNNIDLTYGISTVEETDEIVGEQGVLSYGDGSYCYNWTTQYVGNGVQLRTEANPQRIFDRGGGIRIESHNFTGGAC